MPASGALSLLEKDQQSLQEILAHLKALTHTQHTIVEQGSAAEITSLSHDKKSSLLQLNALIDSIKQRAADIKVHGPDDEHKKMVILMERFRIQCQPLIDDIITTESNDLEAIRRIKEALFNEMKEVSKARGNLKQIKKSFAPLDDKDTVIFDGQG
jgi:hypothetical protein